MKFRPCIDIHNGQVKQIVGGSLQDQGDHAKENFVAGQDASFFAKLYEKYGLTGTDKEISVRVRSDLFNLIKQNESIISDYEDNENGVIDKIDERDEIDG